jgi:hypothetical protein
MTVLTKRKNISKSKKLNKSKKLRGGSGSGSSSSSSSNSSSSRSPRRRSRGVNKKRSSRVEKGKRWNAKKNSNNGVVYGFIGEPGAELFTMQLGELAKAPQSSRVKQKTYNSLPIKQQNFLRAYHLLQKKNREGVGRNKY